MKKLNLWMFAAILSICGTAPLASCSDNSDTPVDEPVVNNDRQRFEQQLSATLDHAAQLAQLDPTIKGLEILTSFVDQLDAKSVATQALDMLLTDVLGNIYTERHSGDLLTFADLGDREAEARLAMKSLLGIDDAEQFLLINAKRSIGDRRITFTQGEKKATVTEADALIVEYKDLDADETTELRFDLSDEEDGVILWVTKSLQTLPVALQFPEDIDITITTGKNGETREVISGKVSLSHLDDTKWFAPKHTEYLAQVYLTASVNDRQEQLIAGLTHYADGVWNATSGLIINNQNVLSISASGMADHYDNDELDQYASMTEMGSGYRAAYTLLRALNVKSVESLRLTIDDDLTFEGRVNDAAKALSALGQTHVLRKDESAKQADFEPLTSQLNQAVTYTAHQRSTGITAEGTFITSFIDDNWLPALALRFNGEKDFQVMYYRLSQHDLDNYYKLLGTFDEPYNTIQNLTKALEQKGKEIADVFSF